VKLKSGGDLDHVLIGPAGVYCISTKSHKGTLTLSSTGQYLLNGNPTDDVEEARMLALKLRNWLEVKLHDSSKVLKPPWVQPVLAIPLIYIEFHFRQDAAWVLHEEGLVDVLPEQPRRLDNQTVQACVSILEEITGLGPKN
jgi:hypothetical protein